MFLYIIKDIREELGISIETLSKISNLDIKLLYEIENNNIKVVKDEILVKLSKALNKKPEEMFYTIYDYEKIRDDMESLVIGEGIKSYKVRKLDIILDKLFNIMLENNIFINKFEAYTKDNHYELKKLNNK